MASALAIGAGASEGLDTYLNRMLQEELAKEATRRSLAQEQLGRDTLAENTKLRRAQQDETARLRASEQLNQRRDDLRSVLTELPPNAAISPATHDAAIQTGAATEDRFKKTIPFGPDFIGPLEKNGPQVGDPQYNLIGKEPNPQATKGLQSEKRLYKGKLTNVNYNPDNGRATLETGEDVTGQTQPYVPPPQPDRVLVQTDQGFRTREQVAADLKAGNRVNPQEPAQVRNRQDMATKVGSHMQDAQDELDQAEKLGLLGPEAGRYSDFMAGKVGSTGNEEYDSLLGALRLDLSAIRSGFASLHGRSGANVGIALQLEKIMDSGFMSHAELTSSLKAIGKWIDAYATPSSPAQAAPANDPYQDYLNRNNKK